MGDFIIFWFIFGLFLVHFWFTYVVKLVYVNTWLLGGLSMVMAMYSGICIFLLYGKDRYFVQFISKKTGHYKSSYK